MLRLFRAGLIAAGHQLVAVASIGTVVSLLAGYDLVVPFGPSRISAGDQIWAVVEPLLSWSDTLTAVGVVFTSAAYLEPTARRIRLASRSMCPSDPGRAANILLAQLWLVSVVLAILVLRPPPDGLIEAGYRHGCAWAVSFGWPGVTSVGLASFWTNARAARKALD
jgi:hypothetical protein